MDKVDMEIIIQENSIKKVVHKVDIRIMMVKEARVIEIPINQGETIEDMIGFPEEVMEETEETIEEISPPEVTL